MPLPSSSVDRWPVSMHRGSAVLKKGRIGDETLCSFTAELNMSNPAQSCCQANNEDLSLEALTAEIVKSQCYEGRHHKVW
jgi:hypothetical protein